MGDLFDLLHEIENIASEMEFCEDFNRLQLILNNCNQFICSFDKIVFDSGNEQYIIEIVARLLRYFRVQNYLDGDNRMNPVYEKQLRQITMYLILNTDVSFRYDLEQDWRVNNVLNSLPQLSKCLLINCIWGLDLDRFLYEMLRYTPLWFSMQYLDQAIVSLRYAKPYEVLERVESMVCAIYFAICRTDDEGRRIDRSQYVVEVRTLGRMFDFVADMLRFFNTPDAAKFVGWSKVRKHRYFGFVLKHMFSMTLFCLDLYFRKPAIPVDPDMALYEILRDFHIRRRVGADFNDTTERTLLKINHCLLNTLEVCIMHVTIERFCYWSEIDLFEEGEETVTLQQVVGESAFRLYEDLKTRRHFRHSIVRQLTQFAMRPKTPAEKVAALTIGALLRRLDSAPTDGDRLIYLNELIARSDLVFGNVECLEALEQQSRLLTGAHLRVMIEYDSPEPSSDMLLDDELPDALVKLRDLILRTVAALPIDDFHQLVSFMIETFGTKFSRYKQPEMFSALVQLTNKIETDTEPPNVQGLLFQAPAIFVDRLIRSMYTMGSVYCEPYVDAIVAIFERHRPVLKPFLCEHLAALLGGSFDIRQSPAMPYLVQRMYERQLVVPHEFFEKYLLPGIVKSFSTGRRDVLYQLLGLYGDLCPSYWKKAEDDLTIRCRLLKMGTKCLTDIVDRMRYDRMKAFSKEEDGSSVDSMAIVTIALEQLIATLQQLQLHASNEDKQRLLDEMTTERKLITQYYFRAHLTVTPTVPEGQTNGTDGLTLGAFLFQNELSPEADKMDIKACLVDFLPQCVTSEAIALARDDRFSPYIPDSYAILIGSTSHTKSPSQKACLRRYFTNLIQCHVQVLFSAEMDRDRGLEACEQAVLEVADLMYHVPRSIAAALCDELNDPLAEMYRHVQHMAPTVDIRSLESFLLGTYDGNPPELMEEEWKE